MPVATSPAALDIVHELRHSSSGILHAACSSRQRCKSDRCHSQPSFDERSSPRRSRIDIIRLHCLAILADAHVVRDGARMLVVDRCTTKVSKNGVSGNLCRVGRKALRRASWVPFRSANPRLCAMTGYLGHSCREPLTVLPRTVSLEISCSAVAGTCELPPGRRSMERAHGLFSTRSASMSVSHELQLSFNNFWPVETRNVDTVTETSIYRGRRTVPKLMRFPVLQCGDEKRCAYLLRAPEVIYRRRIYLSIICVKWSYY